MFENVGNVVSRFYGGCPVLAAPAGRKRVAQRSLLILPKKGDKTEVHSTHVGLVLIMKVTVPAQTLGAPISMAVCGADYTVRDNSDLLTFQFMGRQGLPDHVGGELVS
jgi:hypothetical protein